MSCPTLRRAALTLLLASTLAGCQTAPPAPAARPAAPDPLEARAPVPATSHRSALGRYQASTDVRVGSWREANDTVARVGGWRAYAREASATPPAAAASGAASAATR